MGIIIALIVYFVGAVVSFIFSIKSFILFNERSNLQYSLGYPKLTVPDYIESFCISVASWVGVIICFHEYKKEKTKLKKLKVILKIPEKPKSVFAKYFDVWEYGICKERNARRHKKKKNVQFVLWKAGEQGHKEDYWINFDSYWWNEFKIN